MKKYVVLLYLYPTKFFAHVSEQIEVLGIENTEAEAKKLAAKNLFIMQEEIEQGIFRYGKAEYMVFIKEVEE